MKRQVFLKSTAALLLFAPMSAMAEGDSPLAKQMGALGTAYKALGSEKDGAKGAATARQAQQVVIRCLAETPAMIAKMPDGPEKEKTAAQYRLMLAGVLVKLCEAEQKFLAGDMAAVEKIVADLKQMRKEGHAKFMEE